MSLGAYFSLRGRSLGGLCTQICVLALALHPNSGLTQSQPLLPADLDYQGAFRLPLGFLGGSTWQHGGWALTYYPEGDPSGPDDGYPGSLFGIGHPDDNMVSEVSIPPPVISATKELNELPVAHTLQPFFDLTDGLIHLAPGTSDAILGGVTYLPAQQGQSNGKFHWSVLAQDQGTGSERGSLGWSGPDQTDPRAEGLWRIGPIGEPDVSATGIERYLFEIPRGWADKHVDGRYLGSGGVGEAGTVGASQGPTLFASAPWRSGDPPPNGAELDATTLLYYPEITDCWINDSCHYPHYSACDDWAGAAWLTAGSKSAVVIVGNKGLPNTYYAEGLSEDCDHWQGSRCSLYQAQFLFYSPDDLAAVAAGHNQPWQVLPYASFDPEQYLWYGCGDRLGGAAFDRDRGLLYVIEQFVDDGAQPLVHVFKAGRGDADCADGVVTLAADRDCSASFEPSGHPLAVATTGSATTRVTRPTTNSDCGVECLRALQQSISLQWSPHTGDARIAGYEVHYGLASRQYTWSIDAAERGAATDTATVSNLSQGTSYYFAVRSRNRDRSLLSAFSNEVCATVGETASTADFGADLVSGEAPLSVSFAAQAPGCTDSWLWDFGDGSSSTEELPTHVYRSAGSYTVSLTVSGPGVADTTIKAGYVTVSAAPAGTIPSGLVAAYGFDEAGDMLALDASGNANDGVLSGPSRTTAGRYGGALSFDGVDDWVTVADDATLDLTNGMTLEAWVKPAALSGWRTALIKETPSGLAYALYAHDNAPRPATYVNTGGADLSIAGAAPLPMGSWSHLASTYDGARLRLYVNAIEVSTTASGSLQQSAEPLRIGGNAMWGEHFSGLIDEVRVYNRALSGAEIQADMNAPVSGEGPSRFSLTLSKTGTGSGQVTSDPPGIDCGTDCQGSYAPDTVVRLTASADAGSSFGGWSGDADCTDGAVTMTAARSCTATFTLDATPSSSDHCVAYERSPLYRTRTRQVAADPGNWIGLIEGAANGDEILLADGLYNLGQYAVAITKAITVRSASGNRDAVVIQGQGYGVPSEGLMVMAPNVTIADLTITGMRNHGISIKGEAGAQAPHIYNVHAYDIGTQHIKGTGVSNGGVVACSSIGYSPDGVSGDYLNGIDIHGGVDWTVRDSELYNIWGDGTGCNVDTNCGTYRAGGGPAILFWNGAEGTLIERNRIIDCFRGIALGFGTPHPGGVVRNNFFFQSAPGDMGIQIDGGSNTRVDHNTVLLGGSYPGAIEIWNSTNLLIRNNLLSQPLWDRGNTTYAARGNKTDATAADLAGPAAPHLSPSSTALDFIPLDGPLVVADDIDGEPRPQGSGLDPGCDEYTAAPSGDCVNLSLPAQTVSTPQTFACQAIDAPSGFEILAPASVTFQASHRITLGSGFRVAPNAVFRAIVRP